MTWLAKLLWILTALIVFFFAALAVNQDSVSLRFLQYSTPEISVFWWLLAAFLLGLFLGLVAVTVVGARSGLRSRRLRSQLTASQTELDKLKTEAVSD